MTSYLDAGVARLWTELILEFGHPSKDLVFRSLWAIAYDDPELLAIITRITTCQSASTISSNLADSIHEHLRKKVPTDSLLLFVAGLEPKFSFILSGVYTDVVRLRYQLAALSHLRVATVEILKLWPAYPKLSRFAYQWGLKFSINSAASAGRPWQQISLKDFNRLTLDVKNLLCSEAELMVALIDNGAQCRIDVGMIKEDRLRLRDARRVFRCYIKALKCGNYVEASNLMDGISIDRIKPELKNQFRKQISNNLRNPELVKDGKYSPLAGDGLKIAKEITGDLKVLSIISKEPSEIAKALVNKEINAASIPKSIVQLLMKYWTEEDAVSLCESENYQLVGNVPEGIARKNLVHWIVSGAYNKTDPVLEAVIKVFDEDDIDSELKEIFNQNAISNLVYLANRRSTVASNEALYRVCIEYFGCGGEKIIKVDDIEELCLHYINDRPIANRQAFAKKLVSYLIKAITSHHDGYKFVGIAETLARKESTLGRKLAESLPKRFIIMILNLSKENFAWLMPLIDARTDYQLLHKTISAERLKVSTSLAEEVQIFEQYPDLLGNSIHERIDIENQIKTEDSVALSIVLLRREPAMLKVLGKSVGEKLFSSACCLADKTPWITKRERGYLNLLATLGSRWAKVIAAVMANMNVTASAGHKLDHVYH